MKPVGITPQPTATTQVTVISPITEENLKNLTAYLIDDLFEELIEKEYEEWRKSYPNESIKKFVFKGPFDANLVHEIAMKLLQNSTDSRLKDDPVVIALSSLSPISSPLTCEALSPEELQSEREIFTEIKVLLKIKRWAKKEILENEKAHPTEAAAAQKAIKEFLSKIEIAKQLQAKDEIPKPTFSDSTVTFLFIKRLEHLHAKESVNRCQTELQNRNNILRIQRIFVLYRPQIALAVALKYCCEKSRISFPKIFSEITQRTDLGIHALVEVERLFLRSIDFQFPCELPQQFRPLPVSDHLPI
jgi:hypothetical protein